MKKKIITPKKEELLHVRLEYIEALENKKILLNAEANFLRIAKSMKNYQTMRQEELKVKVKIHRKMLETNLLIKKLTLLLPQIKIPEYLHHGKPEEKNLGVHEKIRQNVNNANYGDIESQLREIQNRLKTIG